VVAIAHGRGDQAAGGGRAGGGVAAQFVVGVDGLAVAVALPTLQRDLELTTGQLQWVLTAFGLGFGGLLLLGGRLGDLYGRRRLLVAGLALFVAGSPVAGLASATGPLVAARTVQGVGAALAVPATLALIGTMYPPGRARTRALGVLAAMTSAGVISGVLLGGLVTEVAGWRWVFLMVVPPALAAALAAPRVLPEGRAEGAAGPPDLAGGLLGSAAVMLLVYALTRLEAPGRGLVSAALSGVAGLVLLAGFVAWERRAPAPLLRPGILSIRSLRGATLGRRPTPAASPPWCSSAPCISRPPSAPRRCEPGWPCSPWTWWRPWSGSPPGGCWPAARRGRRPWPPSWPAPPPWAGWPGPRSRPATPPTCCRPCWCSASRRRSAS